MGHRVGVVGATGMVGEVLLRILEERRFPAEELRLFASRRSVGRRVAWGGGEIELEAPAEGRFGDLDLVILAAGSRVAREWAPRIADEGPVVIDNSSAFRADPRVPLVIPEINKDALASHRGIVANPNCTATAALMAVAPLHRTAGIRSMITTSFQSVTGTGRAAMHELLDQAGKAVAQVEALRGHEPLDVPPAQVYPHPVAFNVLPQCETFPEGEATSTEEAKMEWEARKILSAPDLVVHATAVRVPVVVGHSLAISLSLAAPMEPAQATEALRAFPGVDVEDRPDRAAYPTPLQVAGRDEVLVGRVRSNPAVPNGLSLWVASDNLRKGAALNNVQIAEALFA